MNARDKTTEEDAMLPFSIPPSIYTFQVKKLGVVFTNLASANYIGRDVKCACVYSAI